VNTSHAYKRHLNRTWCGHSHQSSANFNQHIRLHPCLQLRDLQRRPRAFTASRGWSASPLAGALLHVIGNLFARRHHQGYARAWIWAQSPGLGLLPHSATRMVSMCPDAYDLELPETRIYLGTFIPFWTCMGSFSDRLLFVPKVQY